MFSRWVLKPLMAWLAHSTSSIAYSHRRLEISRVPSGIVFINETFKLSINSDFTSNSEQLCTTATQHKTADLNTPNNTLGMYWNTLTDQLSLIPKRKALQIRNSNLTTKWEVLQESSKMFDPIGFTVPVTIRSKLLMQRLCQMNVEWDEPLEKNLNREWQEILRDLDHLPTASINRWYTPDSTFDPAQVALHTFTDASLKA